MRISGESFGADADWPVLDDSALCVRSANTGPLDAGIEATLFDTSLSGLTVRIDFTFGFDDWFYGDGSRLTTDERIASEAVSARADRIVAHHLASGIDTTSSRTRIFAFLRDTGHVVGTIGIGDAFRFASDVRIAKQAGQTDADVAGALSSAFGVGPARIRVASVQSVGRWRLSHNGDRSAR